MELSGFVRQSIEYKNYKINELGCGMGGTIFELYKKGLQNIVGYDISETAINKANQYAKKMGYKTRFFVQDLTKPLPDFTDNVLFTYTCLEQLKHKMSTVITNIIKSNPRMVVNFEVDYPNAPFLVKKYLDVRDYQNNLIAELENKGVDIIKRKIMNYQPSPLNQISVIKWKLPNK